MKVLITGAGGQIGQALLASRPPSVDAIGMTRGELDVGNRSAVADCIATVRPELIVNSAAFTAVDRAEGEADAARRVNAAGAAHLAEAAARNGARLIQLSTDFVFDGHADVPYSPDSKPAPLSVYGASKYEGELAVRRALPDRSLVLRTAWVYGPRGANFLQTMLTRMQGPAAVTVVDDQVGTPTRDASVADAVWALAGHPALAGVFHWTDAGQASRFDFAVAIGRFAAEFGLVPKHVDIRPVKSAALPMPARRPAFSVLDTRATAAAIGLRPRPWRENLRAVMREIADG